MAYDVRISRLSDETITYSTMSIEIDLAWWELVCDEQLCLMRSSFTLFWDDHLWDYYGVIGVGFGAQSQKVDVVISDGHWSLVSIMWDFKIMIFETMVAWWVAFISISLHPITFINI